MRMKNENDARYQELMETSWRRALDASEKRELARIFNARPDLQSEWAREEALNFVLRRLPNVPVPHNFVAMVEQSVALETGRAARAGGRFRGKGLLRFFWPRLGVGLAAAGVGFFCIHEYRAHARLQMARSVAAVSSVAAIPKLEWLENFDAIHELRANPTLDEELYSLLQNFDTVRQMRVAPGAGGDLLAFSP